METWIVYAVLSMIFAGITSILAKVGLQNIHADLAMGIRTAVIFFLVSIFVFSTDKLKDLSQVTGRQLLFLVLSGITTTLSWLYYYRAMKDGLVSYVSAIDKASILITLVFSFVILKEPLSPKVIMGSLLIFAGMLVLVWK